MIIGARLVNWVHLKKLTFTHVTLRWRKKLSLNPSPIDELGKVPRVGGAMHKPSVPVPMATLRVATTQHCHTDKSVEILTNPHTYQDYMMKTRRGGGEGGGSTKALNYSKHSRKTTNEKTWQECNAKAPATKPKNANPPRMAAMNHH